MFALNNNVICFDSFGVFQHISTDIKKFIGQKNIKTNVFRIKSNDSVMCRYFSIRFIDFMLAGKTLKNSSNLFSPNNFSKNVDIILNYFMTNV